MLLFISSKLVREEVTLSTTLIIMLYIIHFYCCFWILCIHLFCVKRLQVLYVQRIKRCWPWIDSAEHKELLAKDMQQWTCQL